MTHFHQPTINWNAVYIETAPNLTIPSAPTNRHAKRQRNKLARRLRKWTAASLAAELDSTTGKLAAAGRISRVDRLLIEHAPRGHERAQRVARICGDEVAALRMLALMRQEAEPGAPADPTLETVPWSEDP